LKVLVIGGGIIGVATAHELASRGHQVTLLERREGLGLETSFANGGQLGAGEVAPWAGPEVPGLVLRWLHRIDAPFRLSLQADPDQWRWLWQFLLRCRNSARDERALANFGLALLTRARMDGLDALDPVSFDEKRKGILSLFHSEPALRRAEGRMQVLGRAGLVQQCLDAQACQRIEPALGPAVAQGRIAGGIYTPDDRSGDAHLYTAALGARLNQMGVRVITGAEVERLETRGRHVTGARIKGWLFSTERLVLCNGVQAARLAKGLGLRLPIYPVKGYSVTLPAPEKLAPVVSLTDEGRRIVVSRLGERIRAAGMAEIAGYDLALDERRARAVLRALTGLLPQLRDCEEQAEFWCGLRPMTPDGSPLIGQLAPFENLYVNAGHGTLGWTLGLGSAAILADLLEKSPSPLDRDAFSPARF